MKIVFFLLLLSNIVFFLFEFNSVKKLPVQVVDNETKQILLLSELPEEHKAIVEEVVEPGEIVVVDLIDNKVDSTENITLSNQELDLSIPNNENASKSETENNHDLDISNKGIKEEIVEHKQVVAVDLIDNQADSIENIILPVQELDRSIPDIENEFKAEIENDHDLEIDKQILTESSIQGTETAESLKEEMTLSSGKVQQSEKESYCYQLGPFNDQVMLTDWITKNNIDLSQVTKYKKQKKSETGFLVYYPRAESYEKTKQNIQYLKNKGVTDFWLFRRGELKGYISLGLFVKESRAKVLKNRFVEKGINVEIMTRYKEEPEWYADVFSENKLSSSLLEHTGSTCPVKND